jgi:cupin superfamily acireductone dioxygenase involved in methionine salvage
MEQTLTERFYRIYLEELHKDLRQLDLELETFGEIYLKHLNRRDEIFNKADMIINALLKEKEFILNDIERISQRHSPNKPMVDWHKERNP